MDKSPTTDGTATTTSLETATLGGGCFWCIEAALRELPGVDEVVSGYSGGQDPAPDYERVCEGTTGHAEVVQVNFDPREISYRTVLEAFFTLHDPTTMDRQGADVGEQYRSIILHHSPAQEQTARDLIAELDRERVFADPIVTQVGPFTTFHPAEAYHQRYYERNPATGYCRAVVAPKLAKFRKAWAKRADRVETAA
jgi:peptide-methionine (S)-S-oxide reductase